MSDINSGTGAEAIQPPQPVVHPPFPVVRLLYAIAYAILAYFTLHILLILALIQFVVFAINGRVNDELKSFSVNLVQYLADLAAFITFVRDDHPFPLGPFPRH